MAIMQQLKKHAPDEYGWLVPYEGDWHILLNASQVLAQQGWDAGMGAAGQALGLGHLFKPGGSIK